MVMETLAKLVEAGAADGIAKGDGNISPEDTRRPSHDQPTNRDNRTVGDIGSQYRDLVNRVEDRQRMEAADQSSTRVPMAVSDLQREYGRLVRGDDIAPTKQSVEGASSEKRDQAANSERRQEIAKEIREDGKRREDEAREDYEQKYPEQDGCKIIEQAYLRDADGNIVKDNETGESRRADFVVVKDGKIVDVIEVTSETADKRGQMAKEDRIREQGGNYIKDPLSGELIQIPDSVRTTIDRRA